MATNDKNVDEQMTKKLKEIIFSVAVSEFVKALVQFIRLLLSKL